MRTYKYATFNGPGPISSDGRYPVAINREGKVIGSVLKACISYGLQYDDGAFTSIAPPDASTSDALGINMHGVIVGQYYANGGHGFIDDHGVYKTLDVPGATVTEAVGINNKGAVIGNSFSTTNPGSGFVYDHGTYTNIAAPAGSYTQVSSINNRGEIAGIFDSSSGAASYFLYDKGTYTTIGVPDHMEVLPGYSVGAVNDRDQFVGTFLGGSDQMGSSMIMGSTPLLPRRTPSVQLP